MLLTPHILLGIYFAFFYNPWIALPAALISHLLFDFFLPHWNPHLFTETKKNGYLSKNTLTIIIADVLLSLAFVVFFAFKVNTLTQLLVLFACAFLSVLPDIVEIPYYFLNHRGKMIKKMIEFQHKHQAKAGILWGNLSQFTVACLCLWLLLR
jgi:hypothetical protein